MSSWLFTFTFFIHTIPGILSDQRTIISNTTIKTPLSTVEDTPGESSDLWRQLKRKNKFKPKPGVDFRLKAFCYIKSEVALSRSSGSSDRVPVSMYRIIDMVNKPNTDFYEYELQRLGRGVMVDWYREAELEVVDMTRPLGLYRTCERGGEG